MSDKLFRTSIVGGYNKEDVDSYILRLEEELTRAQGKLKEYIELWEEPRGKRKLRHDEDVVILSDAAEGISGTEEEREDIRKGHREENGRNISSDMREKELAAVRQELERVKDELASAKAELGISNQRYEQSEQKRDSLLEVIQRLVENYSGLQTSQFYLAEQVKNIGRMEKRIEMIQNAVAGELQVEVSMNDSFERQGENEGV